MQTQQLNTAEVHSFTAKFTWIRCEAGQVWLSHDGQDIVLDRGQKWFIYGEDRVVIEALQNSRVSLYKDTAKSVAPEQHQALEIATAN